MLVVIDGTGQKDQTEYEKTMKDGFISRLYNESRVYPKQYFRGPSATGSECSDILEKVLNWISLNITYMSQDPVLYLAGYSRGGAIAIAVAQEIKKLALEPQGQIKYDRGTYLISPENSGNFQRELFQETASHWYQLNENIKCLALFDAVDRAWSINTDTIPSNVQMAYHALRDTGSGSRRSFGNTGLKHEIPQRLKTESFKCTHGAMGGLPWKGDHPTELIGYAKYIQKASRINVVTSFILSDTFRDEGLLALDWELPEITGVTKRLITEEQDKTESQRVKMWMWDQMRQRGMVNQ